MLLTLRISSGPDTLTGLKTEKQFGNKGGTIGRSLNNDWVLRDPERFISGRHAQIQYRNDSYYLIDTSTNGIYINDSLQPINSGAAIKLKDGDKLRMGSFEIAVVLGEERMQIASDIELNFDDDTDTGLEALLDANADESVVDRILEKEPDDKSLYDDADEADWSLAGTIDEPLTDTIAGAKPKKVAATKSSKKAKSLPKAKPKPKPKPKPTARGKPANRDGKDTDLLNAFLKGAGLEALSIDPADAEEMLQLTGQVLREMILGLIEALQTRAGLKNDFRLQQTTIQPSANNPLKFSAAVHEALIKLLKPTGSEYMPAVDAVRESFQDIKANQVAMVSAMKTALAEYLSRFDPEELQDKFDRGLKRGAIIGKTNKMKYWDLYIEMYQVLVQTSPDEFPHLYSEEFVKAYEDEIKRLRAAPLSPRRKKENN